MQKIPLVDGWEVRPKSSRFAERIGAGGGATPVTLPHDAVIGTDRSPRATPATGFFDGGVWVYRRLLELGDDETEVTVEVAGPGVLQGLGSADPRGGLPFTGPVQRTFDGRALAVVRPTGSGAITITVSAEGCEAQSAIITAR